MFYRWFCKNYVKTVKLSAKERRDGTWCMFLHYFSSQLDHWTAFCLSLSLPHSFIETNKMHMAWKRAEWTQCNKRAQLTLLCCNLPFLSILKKDGSSDKVPTSENTLTNVQINWLHDNNYPWNKSTTLSVMLTSHMLIWLFRDL